MIFAVFYVIWEVYAFMSKMLQFLVTTLNFDAEKVVFSTEKFWRTQKDVDNKFVLFIKGYYDH